VALATERLLLRPWVPADETPMAAINRDPEVTRYLNRPVDEPAVEAFFADMTGHWARHGFGFYAVELREQGRFIGFVGAAYPAYLPELDRRPELGWRLARDFWGRGLAGEAAAAARDDAFGRLGLAELISVIHPANARSRSVAGRLGMAVERRVHNPHIDRDVEVWRLGASER